MNLKSLFAVIVCTGVLSGFAQAQPPEPPAPLPAPEPDVPEPIRPMSPREAVEVYFSVGDRIDRSKIVELKSLAEKEAFVKEYEHRFDRLRRALRHRFKRPPGLTPAIMAPHHRNFRNFARLLALDGQVREGKGDNSGAARSYLDAVQFGSEVQRDGWQWDFLIGNATEVTGRQPLWPLVGKLERETALAAARRLETIEAQHHPFAEVLRGELEIGLGFMQAEWKEAASSPFDREQFAREYRRMTGAELGADVRPPFFDTEQVSEEYRRLMEGEIAAARRPYQASGQIPTPYDPARKEVEEDEPELVLPMDANKMAGIYFRMVKPLIDRSRLDYTRTRAQNAMLVVALMVRAFQADQGRYPVTLKELVPQYLRAVPVDPFGHGEPLQYQRKDGDYLLYSVGPDGKDDGGRPILNESEEHESRRMRAEPGSKGDIVAGINR